MQSGTGFRLKLNLITCQKGVKTNTFKYLKRGAENAIFLTWPPRILPTHPTHPREESAEFQDKWVVERLTKIAILSENLSLFSYHKSSDIMNISQLLNVQREFFDTGFAISVCTLCRLSVEIS